LFEFQAISKGTVINFIGLDWKSNFQEFTHN
jgi:hypothetical protein